MTFIKFFNCENLDVLNANLESGLIDDYSLVFISGTKQIWTQGVTYNCPYSAEEVTQMFNNNNTEIIQLIEGLKATATQSSDGLMSSADKTKLDSLEKITVDSTLSSTSTNPIRNDVVTAALNNKSDSDHTHNYAGSSSAGGAANSVKSTMILRVNSGSTEGTDKYTFDGSSAKNLDIKAGNNVTLTAGSGTLTIAATDTTYGEATSSSAGLMSASDKAKLDGMDGGTGEVNQNAFSNFKVGDTTIESDSKTDTIELAAGSNVTLTADATNDKITISATDTTYGDATTSSSGLMSASDKSKLDDIAEGANAYVHPSYTAKSSGLYKVTVDNQGHVSTTAAVSKSDITALGIPEADTNTTYTFAGGTNKFTVTPSGGSAQTVTVTPSITNNVTYTGTLVDEQVATFEGTSGQVKASGYTIASSVPAGAKFTDTTYGAATTSAAGLMSATDKAKLDGIASGAQVNSVTSVAGKTGAVTLSKSDVGLGNVTNESKATMFSSAALTGTPTAPTASSGTNTTQIATTAFVQSAIDSKIAAADAMIYKGTVSKNGDLPSATAKTGWTYKVATAGTYAGSACEVGDMIICLTDGSSSTAATWTIVQNNIDGAVTGPSSSTDAHVAVFNGATGKIIKDSGFTIGKSVPSNAVFTDTNTKVTSVGNHYTPSDGTTTSASGGTLTDITNSSSGVQVVTGVTKDAAGHVTGVTSVALKSVNTNTTYSAGTGLSLSSTTFSVKYGTAAGTACQGNDSRLSNARPASDVYSWAKASSKPTYTYSEVGAAAASHGTHWNNFTARSNSSATWGTLTKANGYTPIFWLDSPANGGVAFSDKGNVVSMQIDGDYYANEGNSLVLHSSNWSNYCAAKSHTHNYAGSSSAGGSATSAVKLDTSTAGSATQPVYFSGGKPVACTYTLGKSVPSNAVFTDTTYSAATTSAAGLMSAADKVKLDSCATSADAVTFTRSLSSGTKIGTITINGTGTDLYCQTNTNTTYSAGTGLTLSSTTFSLSASGVTAGSAGPTAAVTGNNNATVAIPRITVDAYGRVTALSSYNLTCKNTTYSVATASANGLMAAADKSLSNFLQNATTATTLTSLNVGYSTIYATLSAATTISLSGTLTTGRSITVICKPTASFTQPIPTSGSFISMDGDSLSVTSGKVFEINIYAYASGAYSISCKTAK